MYLSGGQATSHLVRLVRYIYIITHTVKQTHRQRVGFESAASTLRTVLIAPPLGLAKIAKRNICWVDPRVRSPIDVELDILFHQSLLDVRNGW